MNNLKTGFASKDPKLGLPCPNLSLSLSLSHPPIVTTTTFETHNKIRSTHNPKNHPKKKKKKTHEAKQCHHGGYRLGVCVWDREREDNKPSKTLAMGSLDEIEESERWKLRSGGSAMDLRSVVVLVFFFFFVCVVMVVCVCEFLKV